MKKIILLIGLFCAVMTVAQNKIYFYFEGGASESYDVSGVDSISFVSPSSQIWKDGILPGKFSVSSTEQVQFAQGNLQYQASTKTWRFAENQYDTLGIANRQISSFNTGWIDLFGWGTSGYDGKYPHMASEIREDYCDGTNSIAGTNYDWGVYNKISNGGNMAGKWRTLTKDEWEYIFNDRTNAENLRSQARVCGVDGYLLLPDGFKCPDGITFTPQSGDDFSVNNYDKNQWQSLEAAGAVFLPCAGSRDGLDVRNVGSYGYYWSSSAYGRRIASEVNFNPIDACVRSLFARVRGYSVRLATDISSLSDEKENLENEQNGQDDNSNESEENNGGNNQEGGENDSNNNSDGNVEGNEANEQGGKLPGKFSVSSTEQVQFAQGNLQYQASTKTWRFAENQYDALGEEANEQISATNTGWIDLFGWGTSGYDGKYPYMTSKIREDYGDGTNSIAGTNYDWGVYNKISNGGNMAGKWRTLTKDEWEYIFNDRTNAENLQSQASVCGVNGYLLLPDGFKCPDGITFTPQSKNFSVNNYDRNQWQSLEAAGAVFLPCAGNRDGSAVNFVGSSGHYWSSSANDSYYADYVYFNWYYASVDYYYRSSGYSVRLATE